MDDARTMTARFVFAADGLVGLDGAADGSACFLGAADGKLATLVIRSVIRSLSSEKSQVLWLSHNTLAKITGLFSMKVYLIVTVIVEMRARKNTLLDSIE